MDNRMSRYVFGLMLIALVLVACGPSTTSDERATDEAIAQVATLTAEAPTATLAPTTPHTPTPTNTATTTPIPVPPTLTPRPTATLSPLPTISDTDREDYGLLSICERMFAVMDDQVLVPDLSDCYEQLLLAVFDTGLTVPVSSSGGMIWLPDGTQGVLFPGIKFRRYSLTDNAIDKTSGRDWGVGEMHLYHYDNRPNEWVVVISIGTAGDWSGYIDLGKSPFDFERPVNEQEQSPLQAGNQFE